MARKTKDHFLSHLQRDGAPQYIARIDVVLNSDPFAPRSFESLAMIEALLAVSRPGLAETAELYGVTVYARDVEQIIQRDRIVVNALVVVGVFLILLVVVRKLWLAVYLLATVLLSYYATLGVTAVFSSLWADKPFGVIEWRVPFFLFTILVAIGEDYNILLVTRAFQERLRWGPIEGLRRGLSKTGGTITACGLIMAGTFGTLMIAELGTLVEIGFALAVGVLLDTFVVRPLLVPAFMMLMWKDEAAPIHSKDKVAAFTIPVPGVSRRAGLSATKDGPEN
jgi:RND superfamily putative drug exporter